MSLYLSPETSPQKPSVHHSPIKKNRKNQEGRDHLPTDLSTDMMDSFSTFVGKPVVNADVSSDTTPIVVTPKVRKPYVFTEKRREAFIKCQEARKKSLQAKKAQNDFAENVNDENKKRLREDKEAVISQMESLKERLSSQETPEHEDVSMNDDYTRKW